jgi:hypothetical protein
MASAPWLTEDMRLRDRLLITGAIALAGALLVVAAGVGGDSGECPGQPAAIEQLQPGCNASALQLDAVSVDLAPGYEGELTINDIAVPVRLISSINRIEYRPGVGREIERLQAQVNRARVTYWRSDLGRDQSSTYAWSFRVT